MPNLATLVSSAAGAGRFVPDKPQLAYAGSGTSNNGKFTIQNYDSSFIYSVSGSGSVSGNTLTVTSSTGNATLTVKSPKGLSFSSGITAYRQAPNQTYTVTIPFQCYYSGGCIGNHCGCGTFYDKDKWNPNDGSPAGFYACCEGRSYYYINYSGSGFSWGGSDYTNGAGEWWKII